jgi:fibronectin type 3 domain-containing protein
MLSAYHSQAGVDRTNPTDASSTISYYLQGASGTKTTIFRHNKYEGQSLLPHLTNSTTNYAIGTFNGNTSGTPFGFKVDGIFSDDSLNALDNGVPGTGHGMRFYQALDENGNIIPNTWFLAQDYTGLSYSNYDYQDNTYIITNIRPVSPPSAPTGAGAAGSTSGIMLTWNANKEGNVVGYRVYRASSPGGTYTLLNPTELVTSTNYNDVLAPAGATSYYQITAVDFNGGESAAATISAMRPNAGPVPAAPSNLNAVALSSGNEVDLSWTDNASNESGFLVQRSTTGQPGSFTTIFTAGANVTSYNDTTNVNPGTTYYYQVIAFNGSGNSSPSNVFNVTTPTQQTAPAAPSNLGATAVSSNRIDLSWTDNSNNETGFEILRRTASGTYSLLTTVGANVTSYGDTSAQPSTQYFYEIVATNGLDSAPSNEANATTSAAPNLTLTGADVGSPAKAGSTVVVTPGSDFDVTGGGTDIWNTSDQFHFAYTQLTGDFEIRTRVAGAIWPSGSTSPLLGLMARETLAGNSRNIYLRTFGDSGAADKLGYRTTTGGTTTSIAGTVNNSFPGTNTWLRLTRVGNTFAGYGSTDGVNWTLISSVSISLPSKIYVGLAVSARTTGTATGQFRDVSVVNTPPTAPAAAINLNASASSSTKVDLTWTDNSNNETGFKIMRKTGSGSFSLLTTVGANVTSYSDTTAVASTQYTYEIVATNNGVDAAPSNTAAVTTPAGVLTFTGIDVGAPAIAGSTTVVTPGTAIDVTAGGNDVWNTSDQFQFAYRQVTGDFDFRARVDSISSGTDPLVGLMARESLAANARNVFMRIFGGAGDSDIFSNRSSTVGTTTSVGGTVLNSYPNNWLRLTRVGNLFTGYASFDGVSWTQIGSITMTMPATMYLGLAVCSRNTSVASTAHFKDISLS